MVYTLAAQPEPGDVPGRSRSAGYRVSMAWSLCITALSMIGKPARCFSRPFVLVLAVGLTLALAACGDDDEGNETAAATAPATETRAEEPAGETETEAGTEAETETEAPEAPETETDFTPTPEHQREEEGGDEEPARSLALFTGRGGRISPRDPRAGVHLGSGGAALRRRPRLRSRVRGRGAGGARGLVSVSRAFDGLRPGEALIGRPIGAGNRGASRPLQSPALSSPRRGGKPWIRAPPSSVS